MQIVRGLHNLKSSHRGCVATIGNFDGVHLGHQAILGRVLDRGQELGVPTAVITFEPNPREYFDPVNAPARLMRLRDKAMALEELSVDRFVVLRFCERLRRWDAPEFVARVLDEALGVRHLVIGQGFRFGRGRTGDVPLLRREGVARGFSVDEVEPFMHGGERVSSTAIRAALVAGNLATAGRLLGRDYRMSGKVIEGKRLGRTLGYATANMRLHRKVTPLAGIFAVRVSGADRGPRDAVASLGTRPTVGGGEVLLEAHVFDFDGDLYGRYLSVDFVEKLRDEARFASLDALVAQMHVDARRARAILATRAAGRAAATMG